MKQLLLLICLVAGMAAGAQKDMPKDFVNGNFKNIDKTVVWQKTYSTNISFKEIAANFKTSGLVEKPETDEPLLYGNMLPFMIDYKAAGASDMGVKPYISNMKYRAYAGIKKTDTGYTVTVKKITTEMETDVKMFGASMKGTTYNFEESAINKKGEWLGSFKGKPAYTLDFAFNKMFEGLFK